MTEQIHAPTDAQTTKHPLRFEAVVTWDRPLTHDLDKPEILQKRLARIPVDGVSVAEFTDTTARVWIETTPEEMDHSVGVITTKLRRVIRQYNRHVIGGDDVTDIPTGSGVKTKLVRHAAEGRTPDDYRGYVSPEDWDKACELVSGLDLDGAPALEADISLRTIEGELGA